MNSTNLCLLRISKTLHTRAYIGRRTYMHVYRTLNVTSQLLSISVNHANFNTQLDLFIFIQFKTIPKFTDVYKHVHYSCMAALSGFANHDGRLVLNIFILHKPQLQASNIYRSNDATSSHVVLSVLKESRSFSYQNGNWYTILLLCNAAWAANSGHPLRAYRAVDLRPCRLFGLNIRILVFQFKWRQ